MEAKNNLTQQQAQYYEFLYQFHTQMENEMVAMQTLQGGGGQQKMSGGTPGKYDWDITTLPHINQCLAIGFIRQSLPPKSFISLKMEEMERIDLLKSYEKPLVICQKIMFEI